ncbi:MAG TPA: hypothetical protein EYG88_00990 [Desulfocapsa sulfexigens]|nr:hypothetical protein [Desulfocapsa sulfexigens]
MAIRTCVTPKKQFIYGIHKPSYNVENLRSKTETGNLGSFDSGEPYSNKTNFPDNNLQVDGADWIFEIPNPLSFRGSTFIDKEWADNSASNLNRISLPQKEEVSLRQLLQEEQISENLIGKLPSPLLLSLATTSTDPADLIQLAELSCRVEKNEDGLPTGLVYTKNPQGRTCAIITNQPLFEAVANNPYLPDSYKTVMVLRPGAQGGSEIVGDYSKANQTHVFEYLRRNSYIAGGHYAANMADDAIRYSIAHLSEQDMTGLRHLYYQRSFVRLASHLGLEIDHKQKGYSTTSLEKLRRKILQALTEGVTPEITATLWGWNFGFDYAPTNYRLHASHQQIHQQYAMLPRKVETFSGDPLNPVGTMPSFGCGDMVAEVIQNYQTTNASDFFADYLDCIKNNVRMDGRNDLEANLVLWENKHAMLFVPKAQTSQWELQLMALENEEEKTVGNILEADTSVRESLNRGIFLAQNALAGLGARMVTSIEYPKRLTCAGDKQHLLYSFLPRLPESPGAFSEAQLRYINGHYPEDFAAVCRLQLKAAKLLD